MTGKLTKLGSRTDNSAVSEPCKGTFVNLPEVGSRFNIFNIDGADKFVLTTELQEVTKVSDKLYVLRTKNSMYQLEVYD